MEKKDNAGGFLKLGNNIIFCPLLPLEAKAIFAYIKSKPENWCFSSDRMARELGCGESTIKKYRALLENTTTNSDDPNAPMLIVKHRTHEGFYTYSINEPSYEIKPVKIQPVKIQPVKIHTIKKDGIAQRKNTLKKKEFRDSEKKQVSFERRNPVADEKRKVAKHFAEANALHDEKKALQDVKRKISEWIQANPEKVAQIEKEQRLRLESERPDMWASARNAMIEAALKMEIRKIIGLGNA